MAIEPESSQPQRNNPLLIRLKCNPSERKQNHPQTSEFPTQASSDDPEHKFNIQKDVEITVQVVPEKPSIDDGVAAKKEIVSFADETVANANVKPWNLRNTKAKGKTPHEEDGKCVRCCGSSPPMKIGEATTNKENSLKVKKSERAKFFIAMSKKEIEEDFLAITGTKPPKRPEKRPRNVQRAIDSILPAFNPIEVTAKLYEVRGVSH